MASAADHADYNRSRNIRPGIRAAWMGGFLFLGFAGGTIYQHHHYVVMLSSACARAAAEHVWDAVCVALAMAAIALGLLGSAADHHHHHHHHHHQQQQSEFCSRRSPAFEEFLNHLLQLGLPAHHTYSYTIAEENDNNIAQLLQLPEAYDDPAIAGGPLIQASAQYRISSPTASIATNTNQGFVSTSQEQQYSRRNADNLQASTILLPLQQQQHLQRSASHEGLIASVNEESRLQAATSSREGEEKKIAHARGSTEISKAECRDEYFAEGREGCKLGYGAVLQDQVQQFAHEAGCGSVQALQGCCAAKASVYSYDNEEEEEECSCVCLQESAEINRKADAFIASFREQMRREMRRDLMLSCS